MITIKEKWNSFEQEKPPNGASCFVANKSGDDYLVGVYKKDGHFEYMIPIGGGSPEFEWDFYYYGYWIEFDIELPEMKEIEK